MQRLRTNGTIPHSPICLHDVHRPLCCCTAFCYSIKHILLAIRQISIQWQYSCLCSACTFSLLTHTTHIITSKIPGDTIHFTHSILTRSLRIMYIMTCLYAYYMQNITVASLYFKWLTITSF